MFLWKLYLLFQATTLQDISSNVTTDIEPEGPVESSQWNFKQNRIFNTGDFVEPSSIYPIPSVNATELNRRIELGQDLLVVFSAEWCHACRNFIKELAYAARFLANFNVTLSKPLETLPDMVLIDLNTNEDIFESFGIDLVPQAIFISGNDDMKISEYTGNNKRLSIASWLRQPLQWSRYFYVDSIQSWDLINAAASEVTVFCSCPELNALLNNLSEIPVDMVGVVVTSKKVCRTIVKRPIEGCEAYHRIARYSPWERQDLYSYSNVSNMSWETIAQSQYPIRLNDITVGRMLRSSLPLLVGVYPSDKADSLYIRGHQRLEQIASQLDLPLNLGEMGIETPFERRFADYIGLSSLWDNDENTALTFQPPLMLLLLVSSKIVFPKNNIASIPINTKLNQLDEFPLSDMRHLYIYDENDWTLQGDDQVANFIHDALSGRTRPSIIKNEAREYSIKHGVLLNVNAQNLATLIDDDDIDLVVLIYAGWSMQSYKMEVVVTHVAERFSSTGIVFAALNVDTNAVPPVKMTIEGKENGFGQLYIDSYPVVWAFRRNSSIPIQYIGERNAKALEEFVASIFSSRNLTREEL